MKTRIAVMLTAAALLSSLTLMAGDKGNVSKNATARAQQTFSTRDAGVQPRPNDDNVKPEPMRQGPTDYPFPLRAGVGPTAPTVCRHDSLSADLEFRMCTAIWMDTSESVRSSSTTPND